jgi:FG-GAP repeat
VNAFEGVYIDNLSVNMIGNDVRLMRNDPGRYLATSGANNIGVWLPTTGQWIPFGGAAVTFGAPFDDAPVPADYNNDGITNLGVFRPLTGQWFVGEPGGFIVTFGNGSAGDLPAPGDYVTAGLDIIGIYRQPTAQWFVPAFVDGFRMGTGQTDIPVVGDYDGDGKADMAQVGPDPSMGGSLLWRYRRSSDGTIVSANWGGVFEHDIPVQGDFNGDGRTDLAVFRPLTGQWFVAGFAPAIFGLPTDVPVPADYNGDGVTEIAVFRPMTGEWLVLGGPTTFFGAAADVPFGSKR